MELAALSAITYYQSTPPVCLDSPFTLLDSYHMERDFSPLWFGIFLTDNSFGALEALG